jgi:hypothetical protein
MHFNIRLFHESLRAVSQLADVSPPELVFLAGSRAGKSESMVDFDLILLSLSLQENRLCLTIDLAHIFLLLRIKVYSRVSKGS